MGLKKDLKIRKFHGEQEAILIQRAMGRNGEIRLKSKK